MLRVAILGAALPLEGAALARLLPPGFRAVLLDGKPPFLSGPIRPAKGKCCGGLLALDAQTELAAQGLTLPLEVLVNPQIFAVQVLDLVRPSLCRFYPHSYINMDRDRFDRWLLSLVPAARVRMGCRVVSAEQTEDGWHLLHYRRDGRHRTLAARCLVGADGGQSLVRRTFFPEQVIRRYAAVQEWYAAQDAPPVYSALFDREITDCTGWMIAKDGIRMLGAALPLEGAAARFDLLKNKLMQNGIHLGPCIRREGCIVNHPAGIMQLCLGDGGVFLIGEAAGWISPSSLEGISWALKSGAILAKCLAGSKALDAAGLAEIQKLYRSQTVGLRRKLAAKLAKCPFLYTPALRRGILRSGIATLAVRSAASQPFPIP